MLLLSALLGLVAALPSTLTYRISLPVGRAVGVARLPLGACALALTVGVAVGLLLGNA
jgi:hypothetical protein